MTVAVILTIAFIIYESIQIKTYKRNHSKDAALWCAKADYRFKHHRDM